VFVFLSTESLTGSGVSGGSGSFAFAHTISRQQLASLKLGADRSTIEQAVGKGKSALDREVDTGTAVEPMDATCTYYPQQLSNLRNIVQLCYRNNRLATKYAYNAPPGAPLTADSQP
jgi:hypothetical protein